MDKRVNDEIGTLPRCMAPMEIGRMELEIGFEVEIRTNKSKVHQMK